MVPRPGQSTFRMHSTAHPDSSNRDMHFDMSYALSLCWFEGPTPSLSDSGGTTCRVESGLRVEMPLLTSLEAWGSCLFSEASGYRSRQNSPSSKVWTYSQTSLKRRRRLEPAHRPWTFSAPSQHAVSRLVWAFESYFFGDSSRMHYMRCALAIIRAP